MTYPSASTEICIWHLLDGCFPIWWLYLYFSRVEICQTKSGVMWPDLVKFRHFCITLNFFDHFERVHLLIRRNFELIWVNLLCFWAKFHFCKWPNIKQIMSHLVTLDSCYLSSASLSPSEGTCASVARQIVGPVIRSRSGGSDSAHSIGPVFAIDKLLK